MNARTNTFIWQPWFAKLNADLSFTKSTDNSDSVGFTSSTSNVMVTGRGQLSVLEQSKFPFEAHFARSDNRVSNDLAVANGFASQQYGFSQRLGLPQGIAMVGWDRSKQSSGDTGDDRQDTLILQLSHTLERHNFQFTGNRTTSHHERTSENASQDNVSLQHNYTTGPEISVVNNANVSRSELHLVQGESKTQLMQLSSNVFWRPEDEPYTVSGGLRLFGLGGDSSFTGTGGALSTQAYSANAYAGMNYAYNRFTHFNATFNASLFEGNGLRVVQTSQSGGVNYQPDDIDLGFARYNWATSVSVNAQQGRDQSEHGLALQISHRLSQSYTLEGGSTITVDGSQGLTASAINRTSDSTATTEIPLTSTRQLIHSASASWNRYQQSSSQQVQLSISDSRSLDGPEDYFQLVNFQVSSNLPMSESANWNGSLTLQMMRQGNNGTYYTSSNGGVSTSGSGAVSYQNQRLFGLRNLRFGSDLRLNIQAQQTQSLQQTQLSPQSPFTYLESRTNQEVAAWSNRVDYSIGRTQIRLNASISQNTVARNSTSNSAIVATQDAEKRINRSIHLSVTRSFGSN